MKKLIISLFSLLLLLVNSNAQEQTYPKIIKTIPESGDCNVDPNLKEIVLIFDQDMSGGMAVLDSPNMPVSAGKVGWKDKRTFIIPVKLYSDKMYDVALNSSRFSGFRSTNGLPLQPEILIFKTATKNYKQLNSKAYDELFKYFPNYYSYADQKNIDWKKEFENHKKDFLDHNSNIEFGIALHSILRKADDPHISIEIKGQRYSCGGMKITTPNYVRTNYIFKQLKNQKITTPGDFQAGIVENTGYISIDNWNYSIKNLKINCWGHKDSVVTIYDVLNELKSLPNAIIDVRKNSGGNELFAKDFASCFINEPIQYEKVTVRDSITGKFEKEKIKQLYPGNFKMDYKGNIYVLTGPDVMSSNESFILMMKQMKNVKIVGMTTYGSSGNPLPYILSNEIKLYIPSWKAYTLDGKLIEGNGIKPDIEIITSDTNTDMMNKKDVLFDKVLELINSPLSH